MKKIFKNLDKKGILILIGLVFVFFIEVMVLNLVIIGIFSLFNPNQVKKRNAIECFQENRTKTTEDFSQCLDVLGQS